MAPEVAYLAVPHFGVAVAYRADGGLVRRPLALLDDQGRVVDADDRAAARGVQPGMPERQAVARLPSVALLPAARYPIYEAQAELLAQVKYFAERWQPAGLGGAYVDLARLPGNRVEWSQELALAIRRLGWEPSLGATASKFGAWVAGEVAGANTALLLQPAAQRTFLAGQSVAALPLPAESITNLRHLGIHTLGQFARLPLQGISARFGGAGRTAYRWAQGQDDRPVIPPWEAPETSARVEFEPPLADRERLLLALGERTRLLLPPLQERFQAAAYVELTVTRTDRRVIPVRHTFALPTAASEPVRLAVAGALDRVTWDGEPATEISLTLGGITDAPARQLTLFDFDSDNRARLQATLDRLSARFGPDSFRLAALIDADDPLPERRVSLMQW